MDSYYQQLPNQQYEYVNQPTGSDEVYAMELQKEIAKNIVAQINPDNQLYEIEMKLRGFKKDVQTNEWKKRVDFKEIDDRLIDDFMSYLSSIMNQSTSLSNLMDIEINKIMNQAIEWVTDALDNDKYGVNEFTERTKVGHIMLNPMFIVMKRAMGGQESRRMWKSFSLNESGSPNEPPKKQGIMESLKFWK